MLLGMSIWSSQLTEERVTVNSVEGFREIQGNNK